MTTELTFGMCLKLVDLKYSCGYQIESIEGIFNGLALKGQEAARTQNRSVE